MNKNPIIVLIIAFIILTVPITIYLCFLIPQLSEEYNILMASGGIVGGAGYYGASKIPANMKNAGIFKLASNAFTTMIIIVLVEKFIIQIIGAVAVFLVSLIIYKILKGVYKNAKRRKENAELSAEITRNIVKNIK